MRCAPAGSSGGRELPYGAASSGHSASHRPAADGVMTIHQCSPRIGGGSILVIVKPAARAVRRSHSRSWIAALLGSPGLTYSVF